MKKTIISIFLCLTLLAGLCAAAEDAAGKYKLEEGTADQLYAGSILFVSGQQAYEELVEVLAGGVCTVFTQDGSVLFGYDFDSLDQLIQAAVALAAEQTEQSLDPDTYGLGWSEKDGALYLDITVKSKTDSEKMGSIRSNVLVIELSRTLQLPFNRASDGEGYAGVWQLDPAVLGYLLAQAGMPQEFLGLASDLTVELRLNADGSIGLSILLEMGTYADGQIAWSEAIEELSAQTGLTDAAIMTYTLDGDRLTVTISSESIGFSQSQMTLIRVG